MVVPVVYIRIMRVRMPDRLVMMLMRVGFSTIPTEGMGMLMVCVVPMRVSVSQGFMLMLMLVPFRQM